MALQEDRLETYHYELPEELIAQTPAEPRDSSRLFVLHRAEKRWEHRRFTDLPEYLDSDDVVVVNNTAVIRARLVGQRLREEQGRWVEGGRVEFVMLEPMPHLGQWTWEGLFHASAKYVPGLRFKIPTHDGSELIGELVRGSADSPTGTVVAQFNRDPLQTEAGEVPLPKYIQRSPGGGDAATQSQDAHSYQTVYAREKGSAAAPTAGLHFTDRVIDAIKQKGASWEELTLHVGIGTFRPVKDSNIAAHSMHEERYWVTDETAGQITAAKRAGKRLLAVGTTSVRTLESAWDPRERLLRSGSGRTALFLRPGTGPGFQVVDRMLTNFHLPQSTLIMLVCAFAGTEFTLAAYREAVKERYRFFSYGDAMLIL
jgi:S-adenosylmethionine:tRNA ribosyltransferase-isomerase